MAQAGQGGVHIASKSTHKKWKKRERKRVHNINQVGQEFDFLDGLDDQPIPKEPKKYYPATDDSDFFEDAVDDDTTEEPECGICLTPTRILIDQRRRFFNGGFCECKGNVGLRCERCIVEMAGNNPNADTVCRRPWRRDKIRFIYGPMTYAQFLSASQLWFIVGSLVSSFLFLVCIVVLFLDQYVRFLLWWLDWAHRAGRRKNDYTYAITLELAFVTVLVIMAVIFGIFYVMYRFVTRIRPTLYRWYRDYSITRLARVEVIG